jgi:hypothetical protein
MGFPTSMMDAVRTNLRSPKTAFPPMISERERERERAITLSILHRLYSLNTQPLSRWYVYCRVRVGVENCDITTSSELGRYVGLTD